MIHQAMAIDGGSMGGNQRMSPSRLSRGRFSPSGGNVGRGTLQNVLAGRARR